MAKATDDTSESGIGRDGVRIWCLPETRARLARMKVPPHTYDDVLRALLDEHEERREQENVRLSLDQKAQERVH